RSAMVLQLRRWYLVDGGLDERSRPVLTVRPGRRAYGEPELDSIAVDEAVRWTPRASALVFGHGFDGKLEDVRLSAGDDALVRLDFARGIPTWHVYAGRGDDPAGRLVG